MRPRDQRAHVAPLQEALLRDPIAFLSAEHARQTVLLAHLERVARASFSRAARLLAEALLAWLGRELPLHVADEEGSLFPRLLPHDQEGVLRRLQARHANEQMEILLTGLRRAAQGQAPDRAFLPAALAFVAGHRRRLQLEEAEVLPLARRVLTPEALGELAEEMTTRRSNENAPCPMAS